MTDLVKSVPLISRNLMGLRPAQASLYKYMKKCADEQTTVSLDAVAKIYFEEVNPDNYVQLTWNAAQQGWNTIKRRNVLDYFNQPEHIRSKPYYVNMPVKHWMQNTVGSLVMRGLLTVIPNFDIKIIEDAK